jgi:putative transposase
MIWCPKYRRKILKGEIVKATRQILTNICERNGWPILALEVQIDHIHIFLSFPPSIFVSGVVKILKGVSARQLFEQFDALRDINKNGHLWSPSYFVSTCGNVSAQTIQKYIGRSEHIQNRG